MAIARLSVAESVRLADGRSRRHRLVVSVVVGFLAAAAMLSVWLILWRGTMSDFDMAYFGARALRQGQDPYLESWSYVNRMWRWPLAYPLPAVVMTLPFTPLPLLLARAVFVGLTAGVLTWVLTGRHWWALCLLASAPVVQSLAVAQWSPLVAMAPLLPAGGLLLAVKPNLGLALWCASPSIRVARRLGWTALAGFAVTIVLWPEWPGSYLHALAAQPHQSLVVRPFGWVLLLAALRWREPDARLLLALALIPQSGLPYDAVPVLFLARSPLEALTLTALSIPSLWPWIGQVAPGMPHLTFEDMTRIGWPRLLGGVYLPVLAMILFRSKRSETRSFPNSPPASDA